jgi:hypothetical protein
MHRSANGLNFGVFGAVIGPWGDYMAVECAADLFAILNDAGASSHLDCAVFHSFNQINYDLFFKQLSQGHIYGIETRSELVEASRKLAQRLDFQRMVFLNTSVAESSQSELMPSHIDVVTALHACDTATDDAIAFGLLKKARAMVLVPCCQAEVASHLRQNKALNLARTPLAELWRHPLHTREIGSQLTNVLRCLYLESKGYTVTVTELVGWEHSMKNELILARFNGRPKAGAADHLQSLLAEFGLTQTLALRYP